MPSTLATSMTRSRPVTAVSAASLASRGTPSTRARSLPRPQGISASAVSRPLSAPASGRSRPSPPRAATVSPWSEARCASSAACSTLRVVTVRCCGPEAVERLDHGGKRLERPPPGRGRVDEQREAAAHSAAAAAILAARSAAIAPRSAPRRWAPASSFWMSARGHDVVADEPLGVRLLGVLRVEHEQHVLLDGVPVAVGHALGGHQQAAGLGAPVQLEDAQPVGVQPLAVREQEVEAGERRALDRRRHGPPQGLHGVAGVVVAHQEVEEVLGVGVALRGRRAGLGQPRVAHDRAVVAVRVVAEHERVRVLERQAAHRRAPHVHVEDPAAGVGGSEEAVVLEGRLGEAEQPRGRRRRCAR